MPRLVQKCGYIRAAGAGRYMKYIATREGVEKLHGRGPVTPPQKELIAKILTDYPDAKELFEYGDYCGRPHLCQCLRVHRHGSGHQRPHHGGRGRLP